MSKNVEEVEELESSVVLKKFVKNSQKWTKNELKIGSSGPKIPPKKSAKNGLKH